MMRVPLSLSLHFHLLYFLLNSCDGNDALWRHSAREIVQLHCQETPDFISPNLCPRNSPTDYRIWGLIQERVYIVYKHLSVIPGAVTSDLRQRLIDIGKHLTKRHRQSSWSVEKVVTCKHEAKGHHFEHLLNWNRLFSEPPTVYRGKHVFSRHFHRSYLKANKVSKGEGTRKVKYAYHFWTCADAVDRKLSKLVHACQSHTLRKLARFFWDTV